MAAERGLLSWAVVAAVALLVACTPPATRAGSAAAPARPEEAVAGLFAALGEGDFGEATDLTVPGQMVAVALVEGAEVDEAHDLLPSGGRTVGERFWGEFARSFTEFLAVDPGDVRTGDVAAFSAGGRRFARVEVAVPARGVVRAIVAREEDGGIWRIDVFASFAPALAGRLPTVAAEVEGAGDAELAGTLVDLEPSLLAAASLPDAGPELDATVDDAVAALRSLRETGDGGAPRRRAGG